MAGCAGATPSAPRYKSKGCKVGKKELLRGILLDARTRARQTLRLCSYARHPCPSRRVSSRPDGARMDGVYAPKAAQCRRDTVPPDHTHRAPISMKGRRRKRQRRQQAAATAPGESGTRRKRRLEKAGTWKTADRARRKGGIPPDPRRAGPSGLAVRQSSGSAVRRIGRFSAECMFAEKSWSFYQRVHAHRDASHRTGATDRSSTRHVAE